MLDWHPCQICYLLEIKLLLLKGGGSPERLLHKIGLAQIFSYMLLSPPGFTIIGTPYSVK